MLVLTVPFDRLFLWALRPVIEFSRAVLVRGIWPTLPGDLLFGVAVVFSVVIFRRLAPPAAEYV